MARAGSAGVIVDSFGMGKDFAGIGSPKIAYPPLPSSGVDILATVAALGGPDGLFLPLPLPAHVVQIIARLPILELPEAELKEVQVVNETTGKPAFSVQLSRDGAFQAEVPVSLLPEGPHETNTLVATAIARDGISKASDRVTVQCPRQPGTLAVLYRGKPGGPPLPPNLMPACELILDSSWSMNENVNHRRKFEIARTVMGELMKSLPDGTYVGLRLYGHFGFLLQRDNKPARKPNLNDPRIKTDSQLVEPIGLLNTSKRLKIKKAIDGAYPRGDTPLCYSLIQSRNDFPASWQGSKLVILVSDGEENCGGKVEDVAAALRDAGFDITIHVVGFAIQSLTVKQQLQDLARIGRGQYFDAHDAKQLADALRQAVASAEYVVFDGDGKSEVKRGQINGPAISLMPGPYRVGLAGSKDVTVPFRLRNRQPIEMSVNEDGRLLAPGSP